MAKLLEMISISKFFPGVKALEDVSFHVNRGEILALLGENGAGKSTLMKILSGVHQPNAGEILIDGEQVIIKNPKHSQEIGISIIFQELNSVSQMTVAENIYLGREPRKFLNVIDKKRLNAQAKELLKKVGVTSIDATDLMDDLSVAEQQLVEIAKALSFDSKIIIMDEPTATLNEEDTQKLLQIMRDLKQQGLGVIFITHKLDEVFAVADRISVLRDGKYIGSRAIDDVDYDTLVSMMVGRNVDTLYPDIEQHDDNIILNVENLNLDTRLLGINFNLKRGEVVGIAGLLGSGRTELSKAIFGYYSNATGNVTVNNKPIKTIKHAIQNGIALITDDRKQEGLILDMSVAENILLPNYSDISKKGIQIKKNKTEVVNKWIQNLQIKVHDSSVLVGTLSGGNQQKVVLGKWLQKNPQVLILNEPTRGIDIGAKAEIYNIIHDLSTQGVAVIVISSEMPELLGLSHRVLVMRDGQIVANLNKDDVSQEVIFQYASGVAN
ncbi:MAG: sugar ABC transporter ATP-binding protein [Solibacillus sp.]